jgi:hypothetical protein
MVSHTVANLLDLTHLVQSIARWQAGEVDEPSYAGLYFLHWQVASHGKRFASRRNKADPRPDPSLWFEEISALDKQGVRHYLRGVFERYQFFGVIGNVPAALVAWLKLEWPLTLCGRIPGARDVLSMQAAGTRPVTVLSSWPRMLQPVLDKPNAFAFMIHDLEHAWKFFHEPGMHRQQREFFKLLLAALSAGLFEPYFHDPVFSAKFDYLSSDMNTHTLHAAQFLRAMLVEFHLRGENVHHPDHLTRAARNEVAAVMASLFGVNRSEDVLRRMVRRDSAK